MVSDLERQPTSHHCLPPKSTLDRKLSTQELFQVKSQSQLPLPLSIRLWALILSLPPLIKEIMNQ